MKLAIAGFIAVKTHPDVSVQRRHFHLSQVQSKTVAAIIVFTGLAILIVGTLMYALRKRLLRRPAA